MSNSVLDPYKSAALPLPDRITRLELDDTGLEHLKAVTVDRPQPGPDDIAFRVDVNSICFSDVKIVRAGKDHPRLADYDVATQKVVPGHEASITVVEVGDNVKDKFSVGERYTVQADMMKYGSAVGYDIHGAMAQYGIFGPKVQEYLIRVPQQLGYSAVALVEPWACVEASYHRVDINDKDEVVWFCGGGGPMGQMHIIRAISAKKAGSYKNLKTVILTDISDERLQLCRDRYTPMAQEAGLTFHGINPLTDKDNALLDAAAPDGVDYLVALAPVIDVTLDAITRVRRYGVVNLFAGFKRGTGPLNMGNIHYDQITVTGNSGSLIEDMQKVLNKVEQGVLDTDSSVFAVVGMHEAPAAIGTVADASADNKIIMYPQLPHMPLLPITALPDHVDFPAEIAERLRAGYWSQAAEEVLLASALNGAWANS